MSNEFLSIDEAAAELGVTRPTLYKWVKRLGVETFRAIGDRRTLLRRVDVEQLRAPRPTSGALKIAA